MLVSLISGLSGKTRKSVRMVQPDKLDMKKTLKFKCFSIYHAL